MPIETVEESALELMRGGSPNTTFAQEPESDFIVENRRSSRRKRSSVFGESEKLSLREIKNEFVETNRRTSMGKKSGLSVDSDTTREDSIAAFKEQYDSCYFILKTNWKLFLLVFFAFAISCTVVVITYLVLRTPLA